MLKAMGGHCIVVVGVLGLLALEWWDDQKPHSEYRDDSWRPAVGGLVGAGVGAGVEMVPTVGGAEMGAAVGMEASATDGAKLGTMVGGFRSGLGM